MQHYVATRPMFIDVKIMNTDIQVVLGDEGPQADSDSIADGLAILYKEIAGIYYLYS
jgi:exocyst complex component 5